MTLRASPTLYPEVNAILRLLLHNVRAVLGPELVGMYCYGSLSLGDFEPGSSDIDFLVVTEHELPDETVTALGAMHARIAAGGLKLAEKLEGSYIPRAALRRYDPTDTRHPTIGLDWDFGIAEHGSNWVIERHIIREHGVIVWGPPPETLIDPVIPDALRAATRDALDHFWREIPDGPEPEWLRAREYQAFAILTMCRALYTLAHGTVASKPTAAAWAQQALPPPWPVLIAKALIWRHDKRPDDMAEMLDFVRYTIERAKSDGDEHRADEEASPNPGGGGLQPAESGAG